MASTLRINNSLPLYEKFVVYKDKKGNPVDDKRNPINFKALDVTGCIAFTQDPKHKGWIHAGFQIALGIHQLLFCRSGVNQNLFHSMIILEHDPKDEVITLVGPHKKEKKGFCSLLKKICEFFKKVWTFLFGKSTSTCLSKPKFIVKRNRLVLAHGVEDGIHIASRNYLLDKDCQSIVFYRPKNKETRDHLLQIANQTAYTQEKFRKELGVKTYCEKKAPFSYKDLVLSFFHNTKSPNHKKMTKRKAFLLADLLLGNQFLDKKGDPQPFICSAYALSVLQGALMLSGLSEEEKNRVLHENGKLRPRVTLAEFIYQDVIKNPDSYFGKVFKQDKVVRLSGRYAHTGIICKYLDKYSVNLN